MTPIPPTLVRPPARSFRGWAVTAAIASVSAMAVAVTGLVGFRSGRGEADALAAQVHSQKATIDQLTDDLAHTRAERDKLAAELRAKATAAPASPPRPPSARHERDPFDKW